MVPIRKLGDDIKLIFRMLLAFQHLSFKKKNRFFPHEYNRALCLQDILSQAQKFDSQHDTFR